jgi:hypothetical protein
MPYGFRSFVRSIRGAAPGIASIGKTCRYIRSAMKATLSKTEAYRAVDTAFDPLDSVVKRKLLKARA